MHVRVIVGLLVATGCGRIAFTPLTSDAGLDGPGPDVLMPPAKRALVLGSQDACVLEPTGELHCWGRNGNSQLGPVGGNQLAPIRVAADRPWAEVTLGDRHACALDTSGHAWCWGGNGNGELGLSPPGCGNGAIDPGETCDDFNTVNGDMCTCMCQVGLAPPDVVVPTALPDARQYKRIFAKRFTTCGIALDGTLWCWGRNGATQLGVGLPNDDRPAPTQVTIVAPQVGSDTSWARVGIGEDHVCSTQTDGSLWCWGSNANGQLGQNGSSTVVRERPSIVTPGASFTEPASGSNFSCAITVAGALECWGLNDGGQLGLGDLVDRAVPTEVDPGPFTTLAAMAGHACAIRDDNSLVCWGANDSGQLGIGNMTTPQTTPMAVAGTWRVVAVGNGYGCALDLNDAPWCWGSGANGKLGTGGTASTTVPVPVVAF